MILENPFYVLGATTRDNRQTIVELAEDKSFELDEDICQKARSDLTMPRTRLLAEINWFPGVSPRKVNQLIEQLNIASKSIINTEGLSELPSINILGEVISNDKYIFSANEIEKIITQLIEAYENLDIDYLMRDINEDREISKFTQVTDYEQVENEISLKQNQCVKKVIKKLNSLPTRDLIAVMTNIVDTETLNGEVQASSMIDDLVDDYKLHTQDFLEHESQKIYKLIDHIKDKAIDGESSIEPLIDKLIEVTKTWDDVAQPIQLSTKSRGLDHDLSVRVANSIRSLSIGLTNDHGYVELSQKISESLKELFAELPEILERVEDDIDALDNIFYQIQDAQDNQEREERAFKESLKYEVDIGIVMKDKLTISSDGITWKNKTYPLNDITRIRWGATRHSVNGIPTGTTYTISFGNNKSTSLVETRRGSVYEEVIDRLWKTAGMNILTNMLKDFKNNKGLTMDNATIWDDGVSITKPGGWFSSDEKKKFGWSEVQVYSSNGNFVIEAINDNKFITAIEYQGAYNIHFLEQAIRMKFKDPEATNLSDLLKN